MEIILERKIQVKGYQALMEIGIPNPEKQFYIGILMLADDEGQISFREISDQFGLKESMSKRILASLEQFRLLEKTRNNSSIDQDDNEKYDLTESGRWAIENEQIMIPQKGMYLLYTTEDPLFPAHILSYEEQPDRVSDEFEATKERVIRDSKNRTDSRETTKSRHPDWLGKIITSLKKDSKIFDLPAQNNQEIHLINIDGEVFESPKTKSIRVSLVVGEELSSNLLKVKSGNEGTNAVHLPFPLTVLDVLKQIIPEERTNLKKTDSGVQLRVSFGDTDTHERKFFARALTVSSPTIEKFGTFDTTKIEHLPIFPRTKSDAIEWAHWLIVEKIQYFLTEDGYQDLVSEVLGHFSSEYDETDLKKKLPDFEKIKQELTDRREEFPIKYWYVTAPEFLTATIAGDLS